MCQEQLRFCESPCDTQDKKSLKTYTAHIQVTTHTHTSTSKSWAMGGEVIPGNKQRWIVCGGLREILGMRKSHRGKSSELQRRLFLKAGGRLLKLKMRVRAKLWRVLTDMLGSLNILQTRKSTHMDTYVCMCGRNTTTEHSNRSPKYL